MKHNHHDSRLRTELHREKLSESAPFQKLYASKNDSLATLSAHIAVAVILIYAIASSISPQISGIFSVALSIAIALVGYIALLTAPPIKYRLVALLGIVTISTWLNFLAGNNPNTEAMSRYMISMVAIFALPLLPAKFKTNLISLGALFLLIIAVRAAVTGPLLEVAGSVRISSFYGGDGAVHTSAITMVALAIIFWMSPWPRLFKILLVLTAASLLLGYGAITEMMMFGIFCISWIFRNSKRPWLWQTSSLLAMAPFAIMYRETNSVDTATIDQLGLGAVGSGRLDAWTERINIFWTSDTFTKIFGGGPYSDYRTTPLWWWEPKNSHSDILTIFMEFGVLGLLIFVFLVLGILRRSSRSGRPVVMSLLVGMLLSNVVLDRPTTAIFWGLALCMSAANRRDAITRLGPS